MQLSRGAEAPAAAAQVAPVAPLTPAAPAASVLACPGSADVFEFS